MKREIVKSKVLKDYVPKVTDLVKVFDSSEKDFPEKDYKKKNGWQWMISICPNGHITELRKSYCSEGVWTTITCGKHCQNKKGKRK